MPFYFQSRFALVPNADFDVVCYDRRQPMVLSLRERYKQADLEGIALRQVYRNAECFLVTASPDEARSVSRKIADGDIAGLNRCVVADTPDYSMLLACLKKRNFARHRNHAHKRERLSGVKCIIPFFIL